ncbi:hypothetical protein GH5_03137 [Leishmania sp. Ghana 2012 LV757]|uniref:hypothetical protein n=1 Tax=Leishmania sp. Ghana 2012 LV757 TaxID=2803181 RepID=UPI001B652750|nr:hypothetical protein GH5_03137 [Leishmania sp. Ghana 2012 LV757]
MQTVAKYKETVVFVSCATLLVGTVMALQKATTPSRHRRRASSSASRAGTAARSASHGAAGARSRSSSRPRVAHLNNTHNSAALTTATAIDRTHASKSRDLTQAHSHRHHSHSRSGGVGVDGTVNRIEASGLTPAPMLTVEAVTQHKRALGTANALQDPGNSDIAGIHVPRRGVSSSGYRVHGGSGSCEEGVYYRSASNAATVGSQAPCPAPACTVAVAASTKDAAKASSPAANAVESLSPCLPLPVLDGSSSVCNEGTHVGREVKADCGEESQAIWGLRRTQMSAACVPTNIRASATQTSPRWFCEDRGTQTESSATRDGVKVAASATPDRWLAAAMMSPIIPDGEDANDSMPINSADLRWTALHDGPVLTGNAAHADTLPCKDSQPSTRYDAEAGVIPRYFLQQLERQVRQLVDDVAHDECNEQTWMRLYAYLSELPSMARRSLALCDRCGTATVAQLVDRLRNSTLTEGNLVEEAVTMPNQEAAEDFIPDLRREVLHLLQHGKAIDPAFHYEWRGSTVAYVEGRLGAASRNAPMSTGTGTGEFDALAHVRIPSSPYSSTSLVPTDDEQHELPLVDDGEAADTSSILSFLAAHLKKYSDLRRRGAATQFPESGMEELWTPLGTKEVTRAGAYGLSTPPNNRQRDADASLLQQYRDQQQQLVSLLASFVRLRQSALFQTVRHTPQHAMFACDFIELVSAAERQLERVSLSPDAPLLMEIPVTQKRLMTETTDIRDTSVGTTTSLGSGSSPTTGQSVRTGAKVGTPMKPSVRYPIQRIVSNLPSPSGLSSQRSSEIPNMYKRLYTPPVSVGEEEHGRGASAAAMGRDRLARGAWAA